MHHVTSCLRLVGNERVNKFYIKSRDWRGTCTTLQLPSLADYESVTPGVGCINDAEECSKINKLACIQSEGSVFLHQLFVS